MTIDVALLRQLAAQPNTKVREDFTELALKSIGTVLLKPTTVAELLDAYEERDRLRDEIERAAQLAVEAKNTILKLRGSLDFAQTETERDRLRTALVYYAEPRNHHDDYLHTNDSYDDLKLPGSRARAALEGRE